VALRNPDDPFWQKHSPAQYRVRVETSRGAFVLEVHRDGAPIGADRFYNLENTDSDARGSESEP
jgi:hypothetical protein